MTVALVGLYLSMTHATFAGDTFSVPAVDSSLGLLGLTTQDLISDRIWAEDDTFLLSPIREALMSPTEAYRVGRDFVDAVPTGLKDLDAVSRMVRFTGADFPEGEVRELNNRISGLEKNHTDWFEPIMSTFALAESCRVQSFQRMSEEQQQALLLALPLWFSDEDIPEDDSLKGSLQRSLSIPVDTTQPVNEDSVLSLLSLVDRNALAAASYVFARALAFAAESFSNSHSQQSKEITVAGVKGGCLAFRHTPLGDFVVGGYGPNVYTGDFAFIVDPGGDDQYLARAGSAVGTHGHDISAVLDVSGNDYYSSPYMAGQACGVMGLGAIVDLGGNDVYRGGAFSQGVGFCGAGFLIDESGDDFYQAGLFAQGAAVCGIGLLDDLEGRDIYDAYHSCQGFASTFAAGALVDSKGNDVYRAGGAVTHAPLRPEDYRSFSQGFAIGARPRAGGGFALLRDREGNDFYDAEIYAQGVGYWYSLGMLLDEQGNDTYNATQYAQGAGIHLAAGVLEDESGDDRYGSRFGPGQGGAHDLSVAMFYDHRGDDQYVMSGGQGMAIFNSAAIFCDGAGNDHYNRQELNLGEGGVNVARGFGSIAVFADGEGNDLHEDRPTESDSTHWVRGLYGMGYDAPVDSVRPREVPPEVTLQLEDTLCDIEDLFHDASLWEVTDNREKVRRARLALVAKGIPAVRWIGENKMGSNDGLERRAIVEVFKQYPDSAAPYLIAALNSKGKDQRKNAISILGELRYKPAAPALISKVDDLDYEMLRSSILSILGELGDRSALDVLARYAKFGKERERIGSVTSLGKLEDPAGFATLLDALDDPAYTVRSAAILAIAGQSPDVLPTMREQLGSGSPAHGESILLAAAELAARWQTVDNLRSKVKKIAALATAHLADGDHRVQGAALVAAGCSMSKSRFERVAEKFSKSEDPLIQARLKQAKQRAK